MNLLTIKNGYKPSNFKWSTNKKHTDIDILNNGSTARLLGNKSGIKGLLSNTGYLIGTDINSFEYKIHSGSSFYIGLVRENHDINSTSNTFVKQLINADIDSSLIFLLDLKTVTITYKDISTVYDISEFSEIGYLWCCDNNSGFSISLFLNRSIKEYIDESSNAVIDCISDYKKESLNILADNVYIDKSTINFINGVEYKKITYTTTNDTPVTVLTLPQENKTVNTYKSSVIRSNSLYNKGTSSYIVGSFMNSSNVSQLGSTSTLWSHGDNTTAVNYSCSGNNVNLNITGESDSNSFITTINPPSLVYSTSWTVGSSGCDFKDISSAISDIKVLDGHRLLLSNEEFTVSSVIQITKQLILQGQTDGLTTTTIQTVASTLAPVSLIEILNSNTILHTLILKQRKTNNTSIETTVNIKNNNAINIYVENCIIETMEFGVVVTADTWQINNCVLSYVGPNNSTRRLIGIYRSGISGVVSNTRYNSGQDGIITGNTRFIQVTSTVGLPSERLNGTLRISNITNLNAYPLHQFINVDYLVSTGLNFIVDNCTVVETSAFLVFYLLNTQLISQITRLIIKGNSLSNSHGKGMVALDGPGPLSPSGNTSFYASSNTVLNESYIGNFVSAYSYLMGYNNTVWTNPQQVLSDSTWYWQIITEIIKN